MDSNALLPSRRRVRKWQGTLRYHARLARDAAKESLSPLYIRSFAWIGSVEPCTGVLCKTCQRCLRDFLIFKVHEGRPSPHHATASSMLAAVGVGCRICSCLWRQFVHVKKIDPENVPREMNEGGKMFSDFWSPGGRVMSSSSLLGFLMFRIGSLDCQLWDLKPLALRNEMVPRIDHFSYQNDRVNLMNQYWKLAKGWLSECLSHHSRCRHVTGVEDCYPTRLIDVRGNSSDSELRLYSTTNGAIREPYMTLSHCWGKAQFLRLTSSTHDRLQQGFALTELPPTFQDAIMVTRALGVNFLWIDALCILQDSIVDWQHEATMMSQIYSGSMCNISALDAQDSTGGLFFDRDTSNVPYSTFTACRKFRRKRVYECAYADFWSDSVQHAPLTGRAWVLQERLLAPRVIHFGKRQLLWECNELRACEVYPRGVRDIDREIGGFPNKDKHLKRSFTAILQGGSDNALTSSQMHETWNDIVRFYTKCNLTLSKDKLVAISGIVKLLQPLFKTDYLAGLWRDDLLEQLLWRASTSDGARRSFAGVKRPKYRAPSWSWASIDAPIVAGLSLSSNVNHIATIIEAHVIPITEDITGQIIDGYIRLRAPIFPVKVDASNHTIYSDLTWDRVRLETQNSTVPDIWPQSAVERLKFVPLLVASDPWYCKLIPLEIEGLILNPVEGKQGVYQRWGTAGFSLWQELDISTLGFQLMNDEWTYKYDPPERFPEQVITLI